MSSPITRTEPTGRRFRSLYAYWITLRVIASYLLLRFVARLRGRDYMQRALRQRNIDNARRVEVAILRLQGLFIKVGQLFSIMTNFLPEEFRQQLEGLQDAVPPVAYDHIRLRFAEEFGKTPDELFAAFDRRAIASASMSQVHRATLPSGEEVAVKVQYPDVERLVRSDLKTFRRILRITNLFFPYQGAEAMFDEISQMLRAELDFAEEARQLEAIRDNFDGCTYAHFPRVFHELSTKRILTTEFLSGIKVTNVAELEAQGIDRAGIARMLIDMYCRQIFVDGLYHADPHPGNIFVLPGPKLALVDFGAVATVSLAMRHGIVEFLQ
ncbi:MAG: AarF/ABC1/UbiB kinase family protein, partial [Myxococcales bacterium]|nr:AarF/ABC1/UbiB kinase family protein [Myxococcales bacterium]